MLIRLRQLLLHRPRRSGQKDYFAIGALGHGLHSLQVTDLHRGRAGQDISGLAHEFGGLDLGAGGDDFAFSDPLRLRGHGQRVLQFVAEDNVLDQHALDLDAPAARDAFDDLADGLGDFLAALDDILEDAGADDVSEGGLRALDEGLADVGDAEGGFVRGGDVVVDYGCEVEGHVIFGHADLFWDLCGEIVSGCIIGGEVGLWKCGLVTHTDYLDLDVDLDQSFGERVNLDETGVDGAIESTEFGDQSDVSLGYWLVWIGTDDTAWDGSTGSDTRTKCSDCVHQQSTSLELESMTTYS